jgi:hypothetical protein
MSKATLVKMTNVRGGTEETGGTVGVSGSPVEWVWRYLRDRYLSHRVYPTLADIVAAVCQA